MKYFSMFSGIGGFELGIKNVIPNAECIGYSEIDKNASAIYDYHFNHKNYGDATAINVSDLPGFSLLVGGFPCQAFSIAGKRQGFEEARGTLFFDIARILKAKKPKFFLLENVTGILSHDDRRTVATIHRVLTGLGYVCQWVVLNSKNFGVPQNRERVFFVGHLRGERQPEILSVGENTGTLQGSNVNIVGTTIGEDCTRLGQRDVVYGPDGLMGCLASSDYKQPKQIYVAAMRGRNPEKPSDRSTGAPTEQRLEINSLGVSNTLTSVQKDNLVIECFNPTAAQDHRIYGTKGLSPTLGSSNGSCKPKIQDQSIRRLTPTECERLQGFPDSWTKYGRYGTEIKEIADTNRYKACGNAVTVNVIEALIRMMQPAMESQLQKVA